MISTDTSACYHIVISTDTVLRHVIYHDSESSSYEFARARHIANDSPFYHQHATSCESSTDTSTCKHRHAIIDISTFEFDRHIDRSSASACYHLVYLTDTSECSHQCEFYRDIGMLSHALPSGELDEHSRATNQCTSPTHWGACGGFWIASEYGGRKHPFKCAKSGTQLLTPFGKIGAALRDGMTIHSPSLVDEHSTRFLYTRGHCLVDCAHELHAREGRFLYKIIA